MSGTPPKSQSPGSSEPGDFASGPGSSEPGDFASGPGSPEPGDLASGPSSPEPDAAASGPGSPAPGFSGGDSPARRDDQVGAEVVGEDYALHDARTGRVHFLNQSAAAVWDLIDGERTVDELVAELSGRFAAEVDVVRPGVLQVLELFRTEGLLRRS